MPPRILFISRPCALTGFVHALRARSSEEIICDSFSHGGRQAKDFTLLRWQTLARKIRQGHYDLIIALSHHGPIWRNNVPLLNNFARVSQTVLKKSSALGLRLLLPAIAQARTSLAILDDDDSIPLAHRNWPLLKACTRYFKINTPIDLKHAYLYQDARTSTPHNLRNLSFVTETIDKIRPCSLGFNTKFIELAPQLLNVAKKTDVFFAGWLTQSHYRQTALAHLLALRDEGYVIDYPVDRLPPEEFAQRCAQAHLTWSPPGGGWECFRTYEVPFTNSVPITCYPNIQRYQPLRQNEHIFFYSPEPEGLKLGVREALQQKDRLRAMSEAGRNFIMRYHHPERLVDYLMEETLSQFEL